MTATINAEQRRILVRYAAGEELPDIAKATQINGDLVNATVAGPLVNFDRQRASQLVRAYDRTHGQAELARQMTSAQRVPAGPRPAEPLTINPGAPAHLYAMFLDEAEATGDRYLVVRVQKVRALLEEIRDRMESTQAERAAREEIARLEEQLADLKAKLRASRGKAAVEPPLVAAAKAAGEPSAAELRAWAAERGIDVPTLGRIPKAVREAWDAEQAEVAA